MGTNDLYSKEIGSALRLGLLRGSAMGTLRHGLQARRRQLSALLIDFFMLLGAGVATEVMSTWRTCRRRPSLG